MTNPILPVDSRPVGYPDRSGDSRPVDTAGAEDAPAWRQASGRRIAWGSYGLALGVVALCTVVAAVMAPYFAPPTLIMVYLLGVMLVATRSGRWAAVLACIAGVAAFDFFFVPPYLTFAVADPQYLVIFAVMLAVGLVIGGLAAQIRQQAASAIAREQRTAALYDLARELADQRGIDETLAAAVSHIGQVFDGEVIGLLPDAAGHLMVQASFPPSATLDPQELRVAQWGYEERVIAGWGIGTLPTSTALYMPLLTSGRALGAIALRPRTLHWPLDPWQADLLEALVSQTAVALERAQLTEKAQKALLQAEAEQLRASLLRSISHDLRPTLAKVTASLSTLVQTGQALDPANRQELIMSAHQEMSQLNRQVANLLEVTDREPDSMVTS